MAAGKLSRPNEERSLDDVEKGSDFSDNLKKLPRGDSLVLLLVGKTGHGKSATGNSILGRDDFNSSMSFVSKTAKTLVKDNIVGGRKICLVDTPGTLDTRDPQKALEEISLAISYIPDGFHAILLILKLGIRMTNEEVTTIELLKKLFGPDVMQYVVFVFTNGDGFNSYMEKKGEEKKDFSGIYCFPGRTNG